MTIWRSRSPSQRPTFRPGSRCCGSRLFRSEHQPYRTAWTRPIPSAGPYYLSSQVGGLQEVVKRNPNYSGPRPRAIEAFVFENGVATPSGADRVSASSADYVWDDNRHTRLSSPSEGRSHSVSATAAPPQKAVGSSISRPRSAPSATSTSTRNAASLRTPNSAKPSTTQSTAARSPRPSLAHHRRARSHPVSPGQAPPVPTLSPGRTSQPPRALSGRKTRRALLVTEAGCSECDQAAAILRRDLSRIGIQLRVKAVDSPFGEAAKPNSPVDLMLSAWYADYPDPADFLN